MVDRGFAQMSVSEFYSGQEILVTGATGFLGKSIIEKLLFSCSNLKRIFLLMRPKRGVKINDRLEKLKEDVVFERIKRSNAQLLDKLCVINGDVRDVGLSLSDEDFAKIRSVSIVIHSAATVRFDEPLKESILMNTRGTREVLLLAKRLENLKIFAHISTAYCNPEFKNCEEKLYPINVGWREAINLAETVDIEVFDILCKKFTNFHPNTYTFSKRLAEHMVNEFAKEMPIFIHRPSIVSPSYSEPMIGWVDNFNGPVGIVLPASLGLSRVLLGNKDYHMSFVPVDYVTNSILVASCKMGQDLKSEQLDEVKIFNYGIGIKDLCKNEGISEIGLKILKEMPLDNMLWYPTTNTTSSVLFYRIQFIIFQLLPALVLDIFLKLFNKKIRLTRILRKMMYVQMSLKFFVINDFDFENFNTCDMLKQLSPADFQTFKCTTFINYYSYLEYCLIGGRKYLVKQEPESIPRAKVRYRVLQVAHYALLTAMTYFAATKLISIHWFEY